MKIAGYLREKYGPWAWMGQRAHDAGGINRILPLDFIICCDYGADVPLFFKGEVFSVEKEKRLRKDWSNEDLNASLRGRLGEEIIEKINGYGRKVNLLCYRSVKRFEKNFKGFDHGVNIFAVPERIKKRFDNKILMYNNLTKLSLNKIPGRTGILGRENFKALRRELSLPFVVQFPYSSSGHYTFILREEKDFTKLAKKYPAQTAILRRYIEGFSLNVNALVLSCCEGVKVAGSFPSVQLAGIPECTRYPAVFCGNDYSAAAGLDKKVFAEVEKQSAVIGRWMAKARYRGLFGMDFVVDADSGKVYPVEINPRFQNSTSLFTALSAVSASPEETLFLLHIAEFLQSGDKIMREYIRKFPYENLMRPLKGAQIILHNNTGVDAVTGGIKPGVYKLNKHGLSFLREGVLPGDCRDTGEILVTCGVPERNMVIAPDAPVCKVQTRESVLDGTRKGLSVDAEKKIRGVYAETGLRNADERELAGV
ncbi:MAG: ATP-grasp domain-containing protein [Candidatus Omnitrophota bacterium]